MRRLLLIASLLFGLVTLAIAQENPVPTLVPPTPIPVEPTAEADNVLTESTVARLQRDGVLRVGILSNEPPFGQYSIQGEVSGFDADLARLLAETWGVEVEFVQATRQNRFDMLASGAVDILMAAVVHQRQLDARFEFSHSYRLGNQVLMVEAEPDVENGEIDISTAFNLGGLPVGYVVGSEGENALSEWATETGIQIVPRPYLTHDQMLSALFGDEVNAIAGRDTRLIQTAFNVLDAVEILDTPLKQEAFGIAMLRQDLHFRNLVNRTLQYLASDAEEWQQSTLEELHTEYFPNDEFPYAAMPIYQNVGDDAPQPSQFPTDVPLPSVYVATNILNTGVVRVAGSVNDEGLSPSQAAVARVNRSIVEQMAQRWGVSVQYVDGDPIQAVASGQADMAIGVTPDWNSAGSVDFSQPYVQHGRRLIYPEDRDYDQLGDLRTTSRIIAWIPSDVGARELAEGYGSTVNINNFSFVQTPEENAADTILDNNNALVIFGDSFLLLPILQSRPQELAIGPTWYDRRYLTFAVPQNDVDMRRLVNYTLQEMILDGALTTTLAPIVPAGDGAPDIGIWQGSETYLGLTLGR